MRRGGRRRRHQRNRSPLPAPDHEDVDCDKDDDDDDDGGGDNGVLGHHLRQFLPQLLTKLAQVLVKEYN